MRRKLGKLYSDFQPRFIGWRLVLIARKFMLAATSIMFNSNAEFQVGWRVVVSGVFTDGGTDYGFVVGGVVLFLWGQAAVSVFVMFIAHVLQSNYQPFLQRAR